MCNVCFKVYMYAYLYMHVYVCFDMCTYVCKYSYANVSMRIYRYVSVNLCMRIHILSLKKNSRGICGAFFSGVAIWTKTRKLKKTQKKHCAAK